MSRRFDTISFLSDYGRVDEFVGVVHSVIRQLSPGTTVIDITHDVAPFDIRAGGLALARSVQYLTPGVVVAVVDPGVGSARRPVALEIGDGSSVVVGPDNGLLAPAVAMVGGATRAVWLNNDEYHLSSPGPLFDGRDIFAPVAAHLCNGVPFDDLGELIEPAGLFPGTFPISEPEDGGLRADVLWVDRYGNVQLNVDPAELDELGSIFELRMGERVRSGRRVHHFSELGVGSVGLAIDSYGFVAIVADRASAAEDLALAPGDQLVLVPLGDDDRRGAPATPVRLSTNPRSAPPADGPTMTNPER